VDGKKFVFIGLAGCSLLLLLALVIVVGVSAKSIVYIEPDEMGVVLSPYEKAGIRPEALEPGRHAVRPGERVVVYNVLPETYTTQSNSAGLDSIRARASGGEELSIDVSATYVVDPSRVPNLYLHWQDRYPNELVRPLVRQTTRDLLSQYTANEISADRPRIELAIFEVLGSGFTKNDLILLEFYITNVQHNK
jgi:regulator of protease activity HflC (stomatin/prohibitin superfamily)